MSVFAGINGGLPMNVDDGGPLDAVGNPIGPVQDPFNTAGGGITGWSQTPIGYVQDPFGTYGGGQMPAAQNPFGSGNYTPAGQFQPNTLQPNQPTQTYGGGNPNAAFDNDYANTINQAQQAFGWASGSPFISASQALGVPGLGATVGGGGQTNAQLGAIASGMNAYADMYGSDRQLQGQLGVAGINQGTQLGVAGIGKEQALGVAGIQDQMNRYIQDQILKGTLSQVDADKLRSQLGLQGVMHTADQQLAGVKDTNQTNLGVAGIQGQSQLGTAAITSADDLLKAGAVTDLARQLMGGGTIGGVGLPGGTGAGTGTGTGTAGTGGASVGQVAGALDALGNPTRPPVIPAASQIGPDALQRLIAQRGDALSRANLDSRRASESMMAKGGMRVDPRAQAMNPYNEYLGMAERGDMADMATNAELSAISANAQNALGPAQIGAGIYGQQLGAASEIQKARELAKLQGQNQLQSTIFGSLLGSLG